MKIKVLAATAVLSLFVSLMGWANTSSATTRTSPAKATIQVDAILTSAKSAGNTLTYTDDLLQNGMKVGSDQGVCVLTGPGPLAVCTVVSLLPKGQLIGAISSPVPAPINQKVTAAIVGGTGAYATARGTADSVSNSSTEHTETVHISG